MNFGNSILPQRCSKRARRRIKLARTLIDASPGSVLLNGAVAVSYLSLLTQRGLLLQNPEAPFKLYLLDHAGMAFQYPHHRLSLLRADPAGPYGLRYFIRGPIDIRGTPYRRKTEPDASSATSMSEFHTYS